MAMLLATLQTPWRCRTKRKHNRRVKEVFKRAATSATRRSGPLQDWFQALLAGGMREPLAQAAVGQGWPADVAAQTLETVALVRSPPGQTCPKCFHSNAEAVILSCRM